MKRREFLKRSSGSIMAASTPVAALSGCSFIPRKRDDYIDPGLSLAQWQAIESVQNHLLPSEQHAPGAKDVYARDYLEWVISAPDFDEQDRKFIPSGLIQLQNLSQTQFQSAFEFLNSEQKEIVLRAFEKTQDGYAWITTIMNYLLEALLTDPLYGGNPDGIGWKWLEHTPGFPRPTVKYTELKKA